MNEWNTVKLADAPLEILDGDRGKNYPSQDEFSGYGYCLFLSTKNVRSIGFDFSECQFVSKERDELLRKGRLKRNDVVLTTRGTVGNLGFFNEKVIYEKIRINSGMVIIRPDESKLFPAFNFYTFRKLQSDFLTFTSGSAQPQLPIRDLREIEISIPSLEEQKAIASVLSSLDDKIDLLHRQNTTLERMAETLFRQWFVEEAQEGWEEVLITKLFDVRDGTHDSPKQKTIGKPLITSKHINGNRLDFESAYLISAEDFEKINQRSKVDKNDILISMIGTIGLIYLEQSDEVNYAIKNVGLFKTSKNPNWMAYTYFWLKSHLGRQFLDEHISGSTQEYVSLGSFRSIAFKKPPTEKLEEFNKVANGYLHKIKNNSAQIQTLEKLRDNLLPKLMSGEVRVTYDA